MYGGKVISLLAGTFLFGCSLAACADHDQLAMCPAYYEFEAIYDEVAAADPTGATAAEAADAVERASGELAQLRSNADERYSAQIDELQSLLGDLERTLRSVSNEADYVIWEPLVDDTLEEVVRANARLRRAVGPACQDEDAAPPFDLNRWSGSSVEQEKLWTV